MIGMIVGSSMSSSARAVRFGTPAGIGLFMKCMTCARTGVFPVVDAGCAVCARASPARLTIAYASRWTRKPRSIISVFASLIVAGSVAFRKNIAAAVPALNFFRPSRRSRLRIAIDTSPKSMSTGQGFRHLWQTVQWSATSPNSSKWRSDTPRRVCSSYRNASVSSDVARILLRGL